MQLGRLLGQTLRARPSCCHRAFGATAADALTVREAVVSVKAAAKAKFDETVEIIVELGVDPRKPNQNIRNTAQVIFPATRPSRVGC